MNLIIGVDPGVTGAIAAFNYQTQKLEEVHDMPNYTVKVNGKDKAKVDLKKLDVILKHYASRTFFSVIEDVGAGPNDGKVSAFSFGFSTGAIHMGLVSAKLPIFAVRPQIWKSVCGLGADKDLSLDRARVLFPEQSMKFLRKKDHGRAEAAILARFGTRFLTTVKDDIFK